MKNWRDEFDEKFGEQIFAGCHCSSDPEISTDLKAFIADLIEKERAAAVAEYQAELNKEDLGEDEGFERFCEAWTRRMYDPKVMQEVMAEMCKHELKRLDEVGK